MSNDHLTDIAYRHFIESVKDYAIYMLSADGTVISWNEGARRAKGYLSDEIIGRYFGLFYSEAEQLSGVPAKNLEIALRSGQFEGEGWRYRKDGSRFWAHVMIDTIRDEQNTLLGFVINKQLAFSVLHHLQKMGISIALDDFGTGYSSLSMLRDFHFDVIKLDRSFITDVESNPQVRSFVRAIISLGNSINTPLIAEGVETAGQLQILEEEGCDEMQGFLFGEPVDIKHLPDRR
ncbi:EAL domain-containing protein [Klebsiella pneumoniae]|nr:EAL domain-containing protein [Klebsiella pneumoniae]